MLEWAPEDRAKLIAYLLETGSKCQQCGTAGWEWEEDRYAYEPSVVQCWGCYLKDLIKDEADMPGSRITLLPKEAAAYLREHPPEAPTRRRR